MSFWMFGRKREGRRPLYSINVPFPVLLIAIALLVTLLLPLIGLLRQWL